MFKAESTAQVEQRRKTCITNMTLSSVSSEPKNAVNRLDPERYSSWTHLVRVNAWVNIFITNCQRSIGERQAGNSLSLEEVKMTEKLLIMKTQHKFFNEEYNLLNRKAELSKRSKTYQLKPVVDEEGIMRSNSRLGYSTDFIPYDTCFPIILPRKSWITRLIIRHFHQQCKHGGTNQVLSHLSSRFWIVAAREAIREVESECTVCRKRNAKASQQIMGPIPEARLGRSMRAFAETAVDYAGPFYTKQGRGKSKSKRYLCVFTCMGCRAVHLEMSYNLDTDSFLNAFYRFTSRRGLPNTVFSDNALNFVGAVNELKEAMDKHIIVENTVKQGIQWMFIPPAAQHFGGVHESMVKSAKRAIFSILGNAAVSDEELQSAFCGAEGLINSRPLTYQSPNPSDEPVLTPNHFLYGQARGQIAPDSVDVTSLNIRKRWRYVQELVKNFLRRWLREFLPMLGQRKKWFRENRDFQCEDVVLVIEPEIGRGQWKMGKIVEVHKGRDNHVRVVDIKVGDKILRRPISRVCVIVEKID